MEFAILRFAGSVRRGTGSSESEQRQPKRLLPGKALNGFGPYWRTRTPIRRRVARTRQGHGTAALNDVLRMGPRGVADQSGIKCLQDRNLVLVVDNDPGILEGLARLLRQHAYPVSHRGLRVAVQPPASTKHGKPLSDRGVRWHQGHRGRPRGTPARARTHRLEISHVGTGCRLPTQMTSGRSQCHCGVAIDNASVGEHIAAEHMT